MRRHDDLTLKEAVRIGLVAFLLGATLLALLQLAAGHALDEDLGFLLGATLLALLHNFALKAYEGRQEPPRAAEAARTPSDKAAR